MGILKKLGILVAGVIIMMPLAGCGEKKDELRESLVSSIEVSEEATKGYIWEATKDGKSVHLVGTMHPAPQKVNYFNDKLISIINEADALAVEIDVTDKELMAGFSSKSNELYTRESGTIKDDLTDESFDNLKKVLDRFGGSYAQVQYLNEYGLVQTLNSAIMQYIGYTGEIADVAIINEFKEQSKEVVSLEDAETQIKAINSTKNLVSIEDVLANINDESLKSEAESCNKLFESYKNSEMEFPESLVVEQKKVLGDAYDILHTDRNEKMVEKINGLIEEDKDYVVAVGYLHYFGEDSVLKMLEEQGYEIKKLS